MPTFSDIASSIISLLAYEFGKDFALTTPVCFKLANLVDAYSNTSDKQVLCSVLSTCPFSLREMDEMTSPLLGDSWYKNTSALLSIVLRRGVEIVYNHRLYEIKDLKDLEYPESNEQQIWYGYTTKPTFKFTHMHSCTRTHTYSAFSALRYELREDHILVCTPSSNILFMGHPFTDVPETLEDFVNGAPTCISPEWVTSKNIHKDLENLKDHGELVVTNH